LELRDLIVTPLLILVVIMGAFIIRPYATNEYTKRYFLPAILLKIMGAISLGLIYQFYYHGGDTYNFHTHGSRIIWEAFNDNPEVGFKLLFSHGDVIHGAYKYISRIPFYQDRASFEVIRIASFFDLFTFSSYSATAIIFSVIGFCGSWAMFNIFYRKYPHLHFPIALAVLFIPSVIFWGSGLLKDTLVLAALGFSVYSIDSLFIGKRFKISLLVLLFLSFYTIFSIKKFVLQAFIPSVILWIYLKNLTSLRSFALRILVAPFIIAIFLFTAYYSVSKVGEGDSKYSVNQLAETAKVTAYDIRYQTGADAGSGYALGELDGSFSSMLRLAPQAINVALFRPYLWEVKNPLMLLSALEGFTFLILTLYVLFKRRTQMMKSIADPTIVFCFVFSICFAFAVGISSFNFGTLARYKIPLLPFYALWLILVLNYENKDKKLEELDKTE
jgi:hypothetical protein